MSEELTPAKALPAASRLVVPRGDPGKASMAFDLSEVDRAEGRVAEIAALTPTKAPELMAAFNTAYIKAIKAQAAIQHELVVARRAVEKISAIVTLDRIPEVLKARGLATAKNPMGSEDIRTAILNSDPEFEAAQTRADFIACCLELVKGKAKAMEMAYTAVKKMLGEQSFNYRGPNTSSGAENPTGPRPNPGFGRPRY
jgi:hypothetical protein